MAEAYRVAAAYKWLFKIAYFDVLAFFLAPIKCGSYDHGLPLLIAHNDYAKAISWAISQKIIERDGLGEVHLNSKRHRFLCLEVPSNQVKV